MNKQEAFLCVINLKHVEDDLRVMYENNLSPNDVGDCNDDAKALYSYILCTKDEEIATECCKIDRFLFHRFVSSDAVGKKLHECVRTLFDIHNWLLSHVYGISKDDIEACHYHINHDDGKCYDAENGGTLPKVTEAKSQSKSEDTTKPLTWAISEGQKAAIRNIIDEGKINKISAMDRLRRIRHYVSDNEMEWPPFATFYEEFHFSNKSDYSKVNKGF